MPALHKSIEHVTLTLSAGTNPASVNLTKGQDPAACTPVYSIREAGAAVAAVNGNILPEVWFDDNAGTARVNAQLLNGDDVQVEIAVVEWDLTKVNVQQGTYTIVSGQANGTAAISAVDQGKAFIVRSERMATTSGFWFDRACHSARFTSDTEITFSRFLSSTIQTTTGRFYVVECIGTEFTVQSVGLAGDASTQGTTTFDLAISAVDMAKTFIVGGYTAGNNDDDPVDGAMWWALTSTTNVQYQRLGGGTPASHFMNVRFFAVTCANDEWTVQRAQPTIGSGETADDTTITAIDQARSVINPGSNMSLTMGHANTTTGADAPGLLLGFTFAADTTVRASRRITGSLASAYAFEVVQFADPNPAASATGAQSLGAPTQAGSGQQSIGGAGASGLMAIGQAGSGLGGGAAGTGVQTLAVPAQAASAKEVIRAVRYILDELGDPILDEFGNPIEDEIAVGLVLAAPAQAAVGGVDADSVGTGAQTLAAAVQDASGTEAFAGTGAQMLLAPTQAGAAKESIGGAAVQMLLAPGQAGSGAESLAGAGVQGLAAPAQAGAGQEEMIGAAAQMLRAPTQAASGATGASVGTGAQTLAIPAQAGTGAVETAGSGVQTLALPAQAASGEQVIAGTGAQALAEIAQAGAGQEEIIGTAAQMLAAPTQAASGAAGAAAGTGAQTLAIPAQAGTGAVETAGTGTQTLALAAQAGTGQEAVAGAGAQMLAAPTQAASAGEIISGAGSQALGALVQAALGLERLAGAGAQVLGATAQTAAGREIAAGAGAQVLPAPAQAAAGAEGLAGAGAQALAAAAQAGLGREEIGGAGAQRLAAVALAAAGSLPGTLLPGHAAAGDGGAAAAANSTGPGAAAGCAGPAALAA